MEGNYVLLAQTNKGKVCLGKISSYSEISKFSEYKLEDLEVYPLLEKSYPKFLLGAIFGTLITTSLVFLYKKFHARKKKS